MFFYSILILDSAFSQNVGQTIQSTSILTDVNLDPEWDWRFGDVTGRIYPDAAYKAYHRSDNGGVTETIIEAPWTQANAWSGLLDNRKEDGWRLLARDFGTPDRSITGLNSRAGAYFVLYNINRSILRFFICVKTQAEYKKGFIELQFYNQEDNLKTPAVLAYLKPIAEAIDKFDKMKENSCSIFSDVVRNNYWLWADFPLSFDPTISPKSDVDPPALYFRIYGQQEFNVSLKGVAEGAQGTLSHVNNWLTGATYDNGSMGISDFQMPNLNFDPNIQSVNLGSLNLKPMATQTSWKSFTNYFSKMGRLIPRVGYENQFKRLFDGFAAKLSSFTNALPISIQGLDIGGIFDFFVTGGSETPIPAEPAPSFIAMNLELTGKIVATIPLHEIRVTIPYTRDEYWNPSLGSAAGIVKNEPLGLLTLTKTPVIHKKIYQRQYDYASYYDYIPYYVDYAEYEIAEDIQISYNPFLDMDLVKTDISLVVDYSSVNTDANLEFVGWINGNSQQHLVELESPINEGRISVRSLPVPIKHAKNRSFSLPTGKESNHRIKIKTVFQRKNKPESQPVVIYASYNVDIIDIDDRNVEAIMPTIPPQKIKCVIPTSGGVRISWDRNLESNIKSYFVERSINKGSYQVIGSTKDTVIVDNEIQKSVKPYLSNRQNVSVNYRVKAKSEWDDFYGIAQSQFSNYSDIVSISGSIIGTFSKSGIEQIVPESYSISHNFPNPFNPSTTIYYGVKEEGIVSVKVFNSLGQEVATLVNDKKEVGYHYAEWNAVGLPSGMYFYRINAGDFTETKKMILIK